jgi:hypothetical protein
VVRRKTKGNPRNILTSRNPGKTSTLLTPNNTGRLNIHAYCAVMTTSRKNSHIVKKSKSSSRETLHLQF